MGHLLFICAWVAYKSDRKTRLVLRGLNRCHTVRAHCSRFVVILVRELHLLKQNQASNLQSSPSSPELSHLKNKTKQGANLLAWPVTQIWLSQWLIKYIQHFIWAKYMVFLLQFNFSSNLDFLLLLLCLVMAMVAFQILACFILNFTKHTLSWLMFHLIIIMSNSSVFTAKEKGVPMGRSEI